MARAAKKVASNDEEITCTSNDGTNGMPTWNCAPETREQFIERVAVEIVTNLRDYDTLKNGRAMATAAFNIATELANLLGRKNEND